LVFCEDSDHMDNLEKALGTSRQAKEYPNSIVLGSD
jgi:hypothetical protein